MLVLLVDTMAMTKLQALLLWETDTEKTARINTHHTSFMFNTLEPILTLCKFAQLLFFTLFCDTFRSIIQNEHVKKTTQESFLFFSFFCHHILLVLPHLQKHRIVFVLICFFIFTFSYQAHSAVKIHWPNKSRRALQTKSQMYLSNLRHRLCKGVCIL